MNNIMKIIKYSLIVLFVFAIAGCTAKKGKQKEDEKLVEKKLAKFEPKDGECLFFIGQDLSATGGVEGYEDGYVNHFDVPAGFTVYTNFSPGEESFGLINKGNDGIRTLDNWGSGDCCAQKYIDDEDYKNSALAIGLSFVKHEEQVANGEHDSLIVDLATWIKGLGKRPVFLRIGYEFDGWEWNNYQKEFYLKSWQRIRSKFDEHEVKNVAYVWQSKGTGTPIETFEEWYPGDSLVDWCGYSYFGIPDTVMLQFARKHKKPVFIAEATPVFQEGETYFDADLEKPEVAQKAWDEWFTGFIKVLNDNKDIVKAFSYINVDWPSQAMWIDNVTFQQVDSRIQTSPLISKNWIEEVSKERYLKPTNDLWNKLWNNN